jgi:hypothetical protein
MSSTSTEYEFTSSLEKDGNIYLTKDRQYLYYNDLQGGNYNANSSEVKFELVSLANTNQFVNWAESFLMIPLELKVAGGLNASPENAFAMSLKNGYQQIIDSLLITVNDNPVNQPCQGSNLEQTFRMYQMSADDRKTLGDMMNFYLDTGDSIRYIPAQTYGVGSPQLNSISAAGAAVFNVNISVVKGQQFVHDNITYTILATVSGVNTCNVTPRPGAPINGINAATSFLTPLNAASSGLGECNNVISKSTLFNPKDGYQSENGVVNKGRYSRQMSTSYDPQTVGNPVSTYYQNVQGATTLFKNHISQNNAAGVTYNIFAIIPMAILHDFFDKLPITRGLAVRLNLYLNTGITIVEQVNDVQHISITSYNIPRQTCPFMVSPIGADPTTGTGLDLDAGTTSLNYSLKIGNGTLSNCRFYASMYTFTPQTESLYISAPERKILYNDVVQYVLPNIQPNQNVNSLITSGISRLRAFLMVPIINANSNVCGLDGKMSPFSSCPATTFPFSKISNFQLQISGKPVFATPVSHTQLFYNTMLRPELSINGGSLRSLGMSSGCISKTEFESGYGFYYVDLSHLENEAEDNMSKAIQVLFTNGAGGSTPLNVDFYIYLYFQKELHLNISNGAFLSI